MHSDPAAVAADLEAWCRPGGILDKDGPSASVYLFDPVARRRTRDAIVDAYIAEQTDVGIGRQFLALATAGPPGVGKSSSIDRRHLAGQAGARCGHARGLPAPRCHRAGRLVRPAEHRPCGRAPADAP